MAIRPSVLVIAGTDSSGNAGLVRDLATLADHDVGACTAITAITAQTDGKVTAVHHVPPEVITEQIAVARAQKSLRAIKIGMLGTAATVEAVVRALRPFSDIPIVIDPVLCSTSGTPLLDREGTKLLRDKLLPLCQLVTPNLNEASILSGLPVTCEPNEVARQARSILMHGPSAVLIKGGHATGVDATDLLFDGPAAPVALSTPRLDFEKRGTGCTLASAITANLANGADLKLACEQAKHYLTGWFAQERRNARSNNVAI